mmetsp:Transcript_7607/g.20627  ORF Transcript_7607/g.20627 Transcript_7607/m.20627 type:complete len:262 (-) Transcript_7607:132-917(-)
MAAEGYHALPVVVARQEDCKPRLHRGVLCRHLPEEAEARVQREGVQPEAEDTVEGEETEGVRGHLRRQHDAQVHAGLGSLVQAHDLSNKLAEDLAGAEGDGNLVTFNCVWEDQRAIILNVNCRLGVRPVVAPMLLARLARAGCGRQDEVPRPCVEDDREGLGLGAPDVDLPKVGSLVRNRLVALEDWHVLLLQRYVVEGRLAGLRDARVVLRQDALGASCCVQGAGQATKCMNSKGRTGEQPSKGVQCLRHMNERLEVHAR